MELNNENFGGSWAEDSNTHHKFFIVNEAVIEKLCILGENEKPCFEGSQFKTTFSLHDEFESLRQTMYSLMKDIMQQGGLNNPMDENKNTNLEPETPATDYKAEPKKEEEEKKPEGSSSSEGKEGQENKNKSEESTEGAEDKKKKEDEDKNKKNYNLAEVEEYQTLKGEYATLQRQYSALKEERDSLSAEIEPLRVFKAEAEKAKKEAMINSFYMLSDEDKKDVITNMDKYSLDEIEAKLAVIGMRNKVNFGLAQDAEPEKAPSQEENSLLYNLQGVQVQDDGIPAWIKAVQETEKNL